MNKQEIQNQIRLHEEEIASIHQLEINHPVTNAQFNEITKLRHQRIYNLKKEIKKLKHQLSMLATTTHVLVKALKQIGDK